MLLSLIRESRILYQEIEIASVYGNISGLKSSEREQLERVYRRRIPPQSLITQELARYLTQLSQSLGRQLGVLINRKGAITHVLAGDAKAVYIPSLADYPLGRRALRGLRLVHTHLKEEPLTEDDITDLALLRLDYVAAIGVREGEPGGIEAAYLLPEAADGGKLHETVSERDFYRFDLRFGEFIQALEGEMDRRRVFSPADKRERALLVSASAKPKYELEESMEELKELAQSADVNVVGSAIQRVKEINPKYLMGEGRLKEIIINALNRGATLLIFDQELNPSQIRSITELTEVKVIDRSQLILDIFAKRAHSREGKVQVELAQLRYMLPKLTGKGTAMSRLMGGIGGRGPGETKLEVDRRRVRERLAFLERELKQISEARRQRKHRRVERGIPIISIVGYTNAGKSTLLNALTKSTTVVEQKMFATLDTASRRLRFPREREVIITDTVGFIRDLPKDLVAAFKATLEELEDADLLMHVVDISNPRFPQQMESVRKILDELKLADKPRLLAFNKADKLAMAERNAVHSRYGGVLVSAKNPRTFGPLLSAIENALWRENIEEAPR